MGFWDYFRDDLKFPPFQGPAEDGRRTYQGLGKHLALGMDKLGERVRAVRDEFMPQTCADGRLEAHGQERIMPRLKGETDDDYRQSVSDAYALYLIAGRPEGYERAVKRATGKPFSVTYLNRDAWLFGRPGFGLKPMGSRDGFLAVIEFLDRLTDDELEAVEASVALTGQAFRDTVVYRVPAAPLGLWVFGVAPFGLTAMGPLWFDHAGGRYYLGAYLLAGATIYADSEAQDYPLANLFDHNRGTYWRSVGATAWLKADLAAAKQVKGLVLLDHNLTSGATITLAANDVDDWGSPPYSAAISWAEGNIVYTLDQTYRYWRLTIDDPDNPDGYLTASVLHLGEVKSA